MDADTANGTGASGHTGRQGLSMTETISKKILVANRGEVTVHPARAIADSGTHSVAVFAHDEASAQHVRIADEAVALEHAGQPKIIGPSSHLDVQRMLAIAHTSDCDAIHPGYGFLSERSDFGRQCADAGICFIGPTPKQLALFGDKARARVLAQTHGLPLVPCSERAVSLEEARAFFTA